MKWSLFLTTALLVTACRAKTQEAVKEDVDNDANKAKTGVETGAQKAGEGIQTGVKKTGEGIGIGFEKAGQGLQRAGDKISGRNRRDGGVSTDGADAGTSGQ